MKQIKDKMIKEGIRLSDCQPNDKIWIRRDERGTGFGQSNIVIVKLKTIGPNLLQMKYKSQYGENPKVQKANVRADVRVERTRKATAADFVSDTAPPEVRLHGIGRNDPEWKDPKGLPTISDSMALSYLINNEQEENSLPGTTPDQEILPPCIDGDQDLRKSGKSADINGSPMSAPSADFIVQALEGLRLGRDLSYLEVLVATLPRS